MAEQQEQTTEKTRTVLIAIDGSKHAEFAFEWYAENVHKDTDDVIMAYCAEHLSSYPPTAMMAGNPAVIQSMVKEHEDHVKKVFKHIDDLAKKYKGVMIVEISSPVHQIRKEIIIDHKLERLLGSPGDSIIKAADEQNVDMIVVGSRGQGTIRRTILGSISDYIIHHSNVPVLICKHEDEHHKVKGH